MTITSAEFFGTAFIICGIDIVIKKRVTLSWGESDTAPETEFKGIKAVIIGLISMLIGYLIMTSDTFSQYTILTL